MNRAARLTVLLSILAASSLAQGVPAGPTKTGLKGTVLDTTGWPVAGTEATLKLDDEDGAPEPRTTTNEKGVFEFLSIQDGIYTLTLRHAGFIAGILRRIEVSENKVTELKPFTLEISGGCGYDLYKAGHVPFSKGNATQGALSAALKDQENRPLPATFIYLVFGESLIFARARTDARGKFTVRDLEPGDYKLLIDRYGFYTEILPGYEVEAGLESVYPPVTLVKCPKGDCDPRHREWILCE